MKVNFKAIKKQLNFLYLLLNENADVGANRKQLFIQAVNENLSKSRRNNPLVLQLANELATTMLIIEDQREVINELYSELNNLARYYDDIENILQHDSNRYEVLRKLNMQKEGEEEFLPVGFHPKDIICIITAPTGKKKDSRKKAIYVKETLSDKTIKITLYNLNSQKLHYSRKHPIRLNFDTLKQYVDVYGEYLVKVSQNAVVNIDFYDFEIDFEKHRCLLMNCDGKGVDRDALEIPLSDRSIDVRQLKQEILKVRHNKEARSFSHEKAEYYINTVRQ
jgi:hypothetical protein